MDRLLDSLKLLRVRSKRREQVADLIYSYMKLYRISEQEARDKVAKHLKSNWA